MKNTGMLAVAGVALAGVLSVTGCAAGTSPTTTVTTTVSDAAPSSGSTYRFLSFTQVTVTGTGAGDAGGKAILAAAKKANLSPLRILYERGTVIVQFEGPADHEILDALRSAVPGSEISAVEAGGQLGTGAVPSSGILVTSPCTTATANIVVSPAGAPLWIYEEKSLSTTYPVNVSPEDAIKQVSTLCGSKAADVSVVAYTLLSS